MKKTFAFLSVFLLGCIIGYQLRNYPLTDKEKIERGWQYVGFAQKTVKTKDGWTSSDFVFRLVCTTPSKTPTPVKFKQTPTPTHTPMFILPQPTPNWTEISARFYVNGWTPPEYDWYRDDDGVICHRIYRCGRSLVITPTPGPEED